MSAIDLTALAGSDGAHLLVQWAMRLGSALVVGALLWLVARGLRRVLERVFRRVDLDPTAAAFVQAVVQLALLTIGVLAVLDQLGVDTTSILASIGVLGLTVGFAAQNALSNVVSGLFLFWDRPFVLGDLVEIDGDYGQVSALTLRSVRLVTPDGKLLTIPNSKVLSAKVASYTNFPSLRIEVRVSVGTGESITRIRELLLPLVQGPDWLDDPAPVVGVAELGDYSNTIVLRGWLRDEKTHVNATLALRERVFDTLAAAGVDMPNETFRLSPLEVQMMAARPAGMG